MKDIRLWGILILALAMRTGMLYSVFAKESKARAEYSWVYRNLVNDLETYNVYGEDDHMKTLAALMSGGTGPIFRFETSRTPAYPALIWGLRCIKSPSTLNSPPGRRPFNDKMFLLSFQVLLDLHLVLLTFLLGRAMAGHGTGLVAALFQAISPLAAAASCRALPDSIFAFLLTLAVLLLVRHFRTGGWRSLLTAGVVLAGACYFHPMGLAFAAVMAMVIVVRPKRIRRTLAFAGVVVACLAPWVVRNAVVAEYWGFSSAPTDSLYWDCAAALEARRQNIPVEKVQEQFRRVERGGRDFIGVMRLLAFQSGKIDTDAVDKAMKAIDDAPCALPPGGLVRYRRERAWGIISAHPVDFLGQHLAGDMAFWKPGATGVLQVLGNYPPSGDLSEGLTGRGFWWIDEDTLPGCVRTGVILCWIMVAVFGIRYLGVLLCGLWRLRVRMTAGGWLCLLLVLTAWLLPGPANGSRFRVPVEPILSVAAAIGWLGLLEWRRRRRDLDKEISRDLPAGRQVQGMQGKKH